MFANGSVTLLYHTISAGYGRNDIASVASMYAPDRIANILIADAIHSFLKYFGTAMSSLLQLY